MLSIKLAKNHSDIPLEVQPQLTLDKENLTYLLYLEDKVIGWGQILFHQNAEYELAHIEIKEHYRKQYYGAKLVRFIIYNVPFKKILATTITPEFFFKLGFKKLAACPKFVDYSSPDCQKCNIQKCTPIFFEKPSFLIKYEEATEQQKKYYALLKKTNPMICEFSPINNKIWSFPENPYFLELDNYLFLIFFPFEKENHAVILPYPEIPEKALKEFSNKLAQLGIKKILYLTNLALAKLDKSFLAQIKTKENPPNFDYLYKVSDFADYPGSKYEKKRNRLKKFIKNYPEHELLDFTLKDETEILKFVDAVCVQQHIAPVYCHEVMQKGFQEDLLTGFFVRLKTKIISCLFYSELNPQTVVVHFEFMDPAYDGVAQLMNNHLGKILKGKYRFINREQDLGLEGLKKSKLSYRPYRILKKYEGLLN